MALATLGNLALRAAAVRKAAMTAGAVRGHGLVLLFHRISRDQSPAQGIVPCVEASLFRQQLEALLKTGEIVPLGDLLGPGPGRRRPRFALTFDDDWSSHGECVLPILQRLGVTATFFLSGRALHGLGPLWFERIDALIAARGVRAAASDLGIDAADRARLALACETDPELQKRIEDWPGEGVQRLGGADIRALADSGMTIGFHTLHHPLLSLVPDSALDETLVQGRKELEAATGSTLHLFAYPHGKADARLTGRLRAAGFVAAFTGHAVPLRPGDDRYLLGRWEPGPIGVDRFLTGVATRLNGWCRRA